MSKKQDKRGRSKGSLYDFVALERYLLRSAAWSSLSCLARSAYIEVAFRYTGSNNGSILLSCEMLAEALGMSKDSARRSLKELVEKGFIVCLSKGGFICKVRHASEWRLTAFKCDVTGELPSKEFMRWQPKIQNTVRFIPPDGTTHRTDKENTPTKQSPRYDPSYREVPKSTYDGTIHRTHLNYLPGGGTKSGERGTAHSRAGASTGVTTDKVVDAPEGWAFVTGQPLKSLVEMDEELPSQFRSWHPQPSTDLETAMKRFGTALKAAAAA